MSEGFLDPRALSAHKLNRSTMPGYTSDAMVSQRSSLSLGQLGTDLYGQQRMHESALLRGHGSSSESGLALSAGLFLLPWFSIGTLQKPSLTASITTTSTLRRSRSPNLSQCSGIDCVEKPSILKPFSRLPSAPRKDGLRLCERCLFSTSAHSASTLAGSEDILPSWFVCSGGAEISPLLCQVAIYFFA